MVIMHNSIWLHQFLMILMVPVIRWFKPNVTWSLFATSCQLCRLSEACSEDCKWWSCDCGILPESASQLPSTWIAITWWMLQWTQFQGPDMSPHSAALEQMFINLRIIWPGTPPHLGSFYLRLPVGVVTVHSVYGSRFNPSSTTSLICKRGKIQITTTKSKFQ